MALTPYLISEAVDRGLSRQRAGPLTGWAVAVLALGMVNGTAGIPRHRTMAKTVLGAVVLTAEAVLVHATRLGAALPRRGHRGGGRKRSRPSSCRLHRRGGAAAESAGRGGRHADPLRDLVRHPVNRCRARPAYLWQGVTTSELAQELAATTAGTPGPWRLSTCTSSG
jgi:hypothetical protein